MESEEIVMVRLRAGKEPLSAEKHGILIPGETVIPMRKSEALGRSDDFEIVEPKKAKE